MERSCTVIMMMIMIILMMKLVLTGRVEIDGTEYYLLQGRSFLHGHRNFIIVAQNFQAGSKEYILQKKDSKLMLKYALVGIMEMVMIVTGVRIFWLQTVDHTLSTICHNLQHVI